MQTAVARAHRTAAMAVAAEVELTVGSEFGGVTECSNGLTLLTNGLALLTHKR